MDKKNYRRGVGMIIINNDGQKINTIDMNYGIDEVTASAWNGFIGNDIFQKNLNETKEELKKINS